jgi:hypothetical protein
LVKRIEGNSRGTVGSRWLWQPSLFQNHNVKSDTPEWDQFGPTIIMFIMAVNKNRPIRRDSGDLFPDRPATSR